MTTKYNHPGIVFFGTPDFATASLQALIDHKYPVLAVVTAVDKPAGRGQKLKASAVKELALAHNIPILQPEKLKNADFLKELKRINADLHVVVAFRMLPEQVWNMPPMGTINVHASLLPQYRGAAPINHAIINGETETGVSTFQLKHEIDTGDLLGQQKINIEPKDNFGTLYTKLMNMGGKLLVKTIEGLGKGEITPIKQSATGRLKAAPKIFKKDCEINWNDTAQNIQNLIRGLAPIPAAFTLLNNKNIKILSSDYKTETPLDAPGAIDTDNKNYLRIAAKDGWVNILTLKPEGKKLMTIRDFLNGYKF